MRCSVQPGRRNSYPRKERDDLILHLKLDNNFIDSTEWEQQVVSGSNLPAFDTDNYYNGGFSTNFGSLSSNPLANQKVEIDQNLSGAIIGTNGKNYLGETVSKEEGDPNFDKVVLLLQKTSAYGEYDINSHTYGNLANQNDSDLPKLKKVSLSKSVPADANDQGKFDAHSFSFGMSSSLIDKQGLIYEGAEGPFDFSQTNFTVEFWAKPALLENFSYLETALGSSDNVYARTNSATTRAEQRTKVDSVILSSRCFNVGYSLSKGFVASVPNGDADTSGANADFVLYSNATTDGVNALSDHDWHHVAFVKDSTQLLLYVNGVLADSLTTSYGSSTGWDGSISKDDSLRGSIDHISIGFDNYGIVTGPNDEGSHDYIGLLDNIRISKGVARYTESSSNPLLPPPNIFPTSESLIRGDLYVDLSYNLNAGGTTDYTASKFSVVEDDSDKRGACKHLTNTSDFALKSVRFDSRSNPADPEFSLENGIFTVDIPAGEPRRQQPINTWRQGLVFEHDWLNLIHGTAPGKLFVTDDFIAIACFDGSRSPTYYQKRGLPRIKLISLNKKDSGTRDDGMGDFKVGAQADVTTHNDVFLGLGAIDMRQNSLYENVAHDGKSFYVFELNDNDTVQNTTTRPAPPVRHWRIKSYKVGIDRTLPRYDSLGNILGRVRNPTEPMGIDRVKIYGEDGGSRGLTQERFSTTSREITNTSVSGPFYALSSDAIPANTSETDWIKISGNEYPWAVLNGTRTVKNGMFALTKNGKSHVYMFAKHKAGSSSPWNSNFYDQELVLEHWTSESGDADDLYMDVNENPADPANGSKGLYKIRYTDSERSENGVNANNWSHPNIIIGDEDYIFIIDDYPLTNSGSIDNKNTTRLGAIANVRKINTLKINDDGSLTLLKDIDISTDTVTSSTFNPHFSPNGAFSFYHRGYLYLSKANNSQYTQLYTDVFKVTGDVDEPLYVIERGENTNFLASHAAGDYIFGEFGVKRATNENSNDGHFSFSMSNGLTFNNKKMVNNTISNSDPYTIFTDSRLAHGASNLIYSPTAQGNSILVSGTGVYPFRDRDDQDSAEQFNLANDFTIEGWIKFKEIPKGDDENPGMTIFDFGNLKLTNTSGFFSMYGPDGDVTDYFEPERVDPRHTNYLLNNKFLHFAVQRRDSDLELWLDDIQAIQGTTANRFALQVEDNDARGTITGIRNTDSTLKVPWNGSRAIGSTISGTHNFTGWIDNFKVWREAIYGPEDVVLGGPYADGIHTSADTDDAGFYYYYYKTLRSSGGSRIRTYGNTKYVYMYEGESIKMWCTVQSLYDPRWSTLRPLPTEIIWYFQPYGYGQIQTIGSSAQGISRWSTTSQSNIRINSTGLGDINIFNLNWDNMGIYTAYVKIGPRNRPKYFYQFPYLTRIYLMVMPWPDPPPPPIARCDITSCGGKVDIGDDAVITASFNPQYRPWRYIYTKAEVMPPGPYTYVWKNKGRAAQDDTYTETWPGAGAARSDVWEGSKLTWTNVRKSIKGPISVEVFDANGNLVGGGSTCPGITVRLPNLQIINLTVPASPFRTNQNWILEDWADPRTTTGRYNTYYAHYYNSYQYSLTSQPGFLENALTLEAIAIDPNIPELETGGIEYSWFVNVYDGDTGQADISTSAYALNDSTYTRTWNENQSGTITCNMRYKNYPAGFGYDPEGRYQSIWPRTCSITWRINAKECGDPLLRADFVTVTPPSATAPPYHPGSSYLTSMTGGALTQLGGGRESRTYNVTIPFNPCDKIWIPLSTLNEAGIKHYARYNQHHGLAKNYIYDSSFWGGLVDARNAYYYYYRFHYTDKSLFKQMSATDDGATQKIIVSNDCGQSEINVNFVMNPQPKPQVWTDSYQNQTVYSRKYITWNWWRGQDFVTLSESTSYYGGQRRANGYIWNQIGQCGAYKVTVNGSSSGWQIQTTVMNSHSGSTHMLQIYNHNLHVGSSAYGFGWRNQGYIQLYLDWKGKPAVNETWTIKVEFASNPKDDNYNWDDALTKSEVTFTLNHKALPEITSHNYNYGWWYWGWRWWGGGWGTNRSGQWNRNTWFRPYYYYYNPYHYSSWRRAYYVYRRPYTYNYSPRINLGRSLRGSTLAQRRY